MVRTGESLEKPIALGFIFDNEGNPLAEVVIDQTAGTERLN
jgi:hypothetical protein